MQATHVQVKAAARVGFVETGERSYGAETIFTQGRMARSIAKGKTAGRKTRAAAGILQKESSPPSKELQLKVGPPKPGRLMLQGKPGAPIPHDPFRLSGVLTPAPLPADKCPAARQFSHLSVRVLQDRRDRCAHKASGPEALAAVAVDGWDAGDKGCAPLAYW
jgi:hypothetical protein